MEMNEACGQGTPEQVLSLLQSGISANGLDEGKCPYLEAAMLNGAHGAEIVRLLLHHGANPNSRDGFGASALLTAIEYRRSDIVDILVKDGAKYDLQSTCRGGSWPMLRKYLDTGTSPNTKIDGEPLLHIAIDNPWHARELVTQLIRRGADINAVDFVGDTALVSAIGEPVTFDINVVAVLIHLGADVDKPNSFESPLMRAVSSEHAAPVVKLLLEHGAKVRWAGKYGLQAIHLATNDLPVFKLLVAAGADMHARTPDGETPMDLALDSGGVDVINYLMHHGDSVTKLDAHGQPVWMRAMGQPSVLESLKERGIDLNQTTADGRNVIQVAVDKERWNAIPNLVSLGVDVDHATPTGETAYTLATKRSHVDQVILIPTLVAAGEKDAVPLSKPPDRPAAAGSDEMAVARFILKSFAHSDHPRVFVTDAHILADDSMTADLGQTLTKRPGIPPDLVKAVDDPAADEPNLFAPIDDIDGILCARGSEIGAHPAQRWVDFYKANPDSDGYFAMSMPVFDASHTVAVVYFLDILQGTGSHGATYILRKKNGEWSIDDIIAGFIT